MEDHSETRTTPVGPDRRRNLRVPLIIQRVRVEDDRRTFFGYAKNISSGGLFIGAAAPKEVGSRFLVEIPLPKQLDDEVRCQCEVVWSRPWVSGMTLEPGMGIRFIDLPDREKQAIDRWIATTREPRPLP